VLAGCDPRWLHASENRQAPSRRRTRARVLDPPKWTRRKAGNRGSTARLDDESDSLSHPRGVLQRQLAEWLLEFLQQGSRPGTSYSGVIVGRGWRPGCAMKKSPAPLRSGLRTCAIDFGISENRPRPWSSRSCTDPSDRLAPRSDIPERGKHVRTSARGRAEPPSPARR